MKKQTNSDTSKKNCLEKLQTLGFAQCVKTDTHDLRGQDHSHSIVEHALSKQQGIQIHINLQLVEDSQDRHCRTKRNTINFQQY